MNEIETKFIRLTDQ